MRVIAGVRKGTKLVTPKVYWIRPTADRIKEFIFDYLGQHRVIDAIVLDLYAGTGSLGIEALSRGAKQATFVDHQKAAAQIIHKNLQLTHLETEARIVVSDAQRFVKSAAKQDTTYDLVFCDPPYERNLFAKSLDILDKANLLAKEGTIVFEHSAAESIQFNLQKLGVIETRKLGDTAVTFLANAKQE